MSVNEVSAPKSSIAPERLAALGLKTGTTETWGGANSTHLIIANAGNSACGKHMISADPLTAGWEISCKTCRKIAVSRFGIDVETGFPS